MAVSLRALQLSDWPLLKSIELDDENQQFSAQAPVSEADLMAFLLSDHSLLKYAQFRWVICEPQTNEGLGFIDVYDADFESKTAWIGILIHSSVRRLNWGSLALQSLSELLPSNGIETMFAEIQPNNPASKAFFIKNGFSVSAVNREILVLSKSCFP